MGNSLGAGGVLGSAPADLSVFLHDLPLPNLAYDKRALLLCSTSIINTNIYVYYILLYSHHNIIDHRLLRQSLPRPPHLVEIPWSTFRCRFRLFACALSHRA